MDFTETREAAERMDKAAERLRNMSSQMGMAQQVREYDSDRRKNLLATYTVKFLKQDNGVAASEAHARADESYQKRLEDLSVQLEAAYVVIARWNAAQAEFEAARSLLSLSKATMEIL